MHAVTASFIVNHSQRLSEKPLTPWIIAKPDGEIITAHCDCMAGLGETCSHGGISFMGHRVWRSFKRLFNSYPEESILGNSSCN